MKDITYKNLRVNFYCDIHGKRHRFGYNINNFPLTIFTQFNTRVYVRPNILDRIIKQIASETTRFPYESLKYYLKEVTITERS